ncbi:unnamed protein product [Fraxinus pennsylvanica]|uniref:Target of Myb protein 1 n=1 Tax=Fraxinus pennsylvanica TaxID=56036 RepID=A0AAD2EEP3_9LAMI|nr:unnamed protein product [Fraxinus pennsylvanica]
MAIAAAVTERVTSDMLIGTDWAVNIELCDIINVDPGQVKDALKIHNKRRGNKNPKIQLLSLFVLETLGEICEENGFQQILEWDVLHDMVKIVKKKSDLNVREKILIMMDTRQEALEGPWGRFPHYHAAYNELKAAGVELPPGEENSVPLFTPPQTHPVVHPASAYEEAAVQASLLADPSGLSLPEIQNAEGLADILTEILVALDMKNSQGVKDELIIDLVEQCRSYQKRVMILVNNTADEDLLCEGVALNDNLQRVLTQHVDIAKGTPMVLVATRETPIAPLMNVNEEDDESEDDFAQLAHGSSRDTPQGHGLKPVVVKSEPKPIIRVLPAPSSRKPTSANSGTVDFLCGDVYETEKSSGTSGSTTILELSPTLSFSPINDSINPTASLFAPKTTYDESAHTSKSADQLPLAPWDDSSPGTHPPPPRYNQRQQFFELQYPHGSGPFHSSSGARESQNPSI